MKLLASMGNDETVCERARVSRAKHNAESSKTSNENLIRFLLEHDHGTPFEFVVFQFEVKAPIFVARQWLRHRMGSFVEQSAREIELTEYYTPKPENVGEGVTNTDISQYHHVLWLEKDWFNDLCRKNPKDLKRAREVFRGLLGTSYYTTFVWCVNLRSLMNWMNQRLAEEAQFEIRQYAITIISMLRPIVPISINSFAALQEMKSQQRYTVEELERIFESCQNLNQPSPKHKPLVDFFERVLSIE